ncbi:M23 family metallopeptidase [Streptomyces sp. HUAS TT20]|uniref:M23 family metallopeptidase n=1 Tax=Streptomyces sp. HUAS TT20 TaxID=3447509 RepID=UPI0021DAAD1F|nr:LysM peptidoglycan-binding domain-containing M23 family metallopeptidase [Streptomyces sp. HUAS 15-9]UXY31215.1 LysM peptidoglycan-binding domain-containing M23 family metallopeptidase [Streptomyces sp. HUAS 15-9]
MPRKGKHRRPKHRRFSRSVAVAGTGGAALALPLIGATGAHAATPESVSAQAVQSVPTAEKKAAAADSGVRTYTVKTGDYLSKIAEEQSVRGGWHRLYRDNREAVGDNPSLIHPGLKLALGGKAGTATKSSAPAPSSASKSSASKPSALKPSASQASVSNSASASGVSAESAGTVQAAVASSGYTLPVAGAAIGTNYHVPGSMWSSGYHTGVDFVVPTGTSLKAVAAGTVVSAGWGGAYGNQVVIKLDDGYYAQYAHLSQISVSAGQSVTAGRQIGLSGATGNVTGPHLHFEIRTTPDYGSDVDPVAYLRSHGVPVA